MALNVPPLSPFMYGLLVGIEAMEYKLAVMAPEKIRNNPLYLDQFNKGVKMGYMLGLLLNGH